MIAVRAQALYTPLQRIDGGVVLIEGDRIAKVGGPIPAGAEVIDAEVVAPGYIDLQVNGAYGIDFAEEPARAAEVSARLWETGVTAFLPTLVSLPRERYPALIESLRAAPGALGVHLEGPFLSVAGAHERRHLSVARVDDIEWMTSSGAVRLVTLSPSADPDLRLLRGLIERGVRVAIGHTAATAEETQQAIDAGARLGTHVFNAMKFHHREPGAAGALLADDRCAVGLIADGVHLAPRTVKLVARCKPPPRAVLVTDAMAAMGLPPGTSRLAGREVVVTETSAGLPDGTLAGSVLTMDAAVRNYRNFANCKIEEALAAATLAPAEAIGEPQRGRIAAGCFAEMVLLDRELRVTGTISGGAVRRR